MKALIALFAMAMLISMPASAHGKHKHRYYPMVEWHCHYDSYGDRYCHEHRVDKRKKKHHYHEDPYRSDDRFYEPRRELEEECIEYRQSEFGIRYCVRAR